MDSTPFTKHPYADARNAVAVALSLWILALGLAARAGALERLGGPTLAALLVFMSGLAVAAVTMDRRIAAWIATRPVVERVAASGFARPVAAALALALPLSVAPAAQALAAGLADARAALLLAAMPALAGLAAALSLAWARGTPAARRMPRPLASPRISR